MQNSSIPAKIPVPFADSAGDTYKRAIANTSQIGIQLGAASFPDGFPPECFAPISAGGSWPFGQDFNGLENQTTSWLRWFQAGGVIKYDLAFQTAIGGYPLGARVESATNLGLIWRSTAENNVTNPDSGGAGWSVIAFPDPGSAAFIIHALTSGGANLRFEGDGTTTPNKTIRVLAGVLQIVNSAYSAAVFALSDVGDLSGIRDFAASRTITAGTGDIVAISGNIRSGLDLQAGRNLVATHGVYGAVGTGFSHTQAFFTSSTFTVPADVTQAEVFVWGGGGGSSGGIGAGGGGGGYSRRLLYALTPGLGIAATVGSGGTAGTNGSGATAGGSSSFGAFCSATGGSPGNSGAAPGGTGSGGDINLSGQASTDLNEGGSFSTGTVGCAAGGAAPFGGFPGTMNAAGIDLAPTFPGGGGSANANVATGQNGAQGMIVVRW